MNESPYPELTTERLVLRGFEHADAPEVAQLAGDRAIAATTLTIPHPYPPEAADRWIADQGAKFANGEAVVFAVTLRADGALAGAMGLAIKETHRRAELGYWIARAHWGHGYATEAAHAVLEYAFDALELNRVFAQHFAGNPASGRVLQKLGMTYEGLLRQHILKWDEWVDVAVYGILRSERGRLTEAASGGRTA